MKKTNAQRETTPLQRRCAMEEPLPPIRSCGGYGHVGCVGVGAGVCVCVCVSVSLHVGVGVGAGVGVS